MIDVKIISKPKNEGSTSAVNTGSTAYSSMAVKEAAHAAKADIAETAKELDGTSSVWNTIRSWISGATDGLKNIFLRKDQDDTTEHKLTMGEAVVKGALTVGGNATVGENSTVGGNTTVEGSATIDGNTTVGGDATVTGTATVDGNTTVGGDATITGKVVTDDIHSSDSDGNTSMTGKGWTLKNVKDGTGSYSVLAVDNLVVRKKLEAAELEIHKKTYVGAQMIASDWGHKILKVEPVSVDFGTGSVDVKSIGLMLFTLPVTVDGVQRSVAFVGKALSDTETRVELLGDGKGILNRELETTANAFKVYFCESDGTASIEDDLVVGTMGQCQEFNVKERVNQNFTNTYYWGVCVEHGVEEILIGDKPTKYVYGVFAHTTENITLRSEATGHEGQTFTCYGMEQSDCTFPVAGDDMVGFGCADPWQDEDRCNAIVIASKDGEQSAPSVISYSGIGRKRSWYTVGTPGTDGAYQDYSGIGEQYSVPTGKDDDRLDFRLSKKAGNVFKGDLYFKGSDGETLQPVRESETTSVWQLVPVTEEAEIGYSIDKDAYKSYQDAALKGGAQNGGAAVNGGAQNHTDAAAGVFKKEGTVNLQYQIKHQQGDGGPEVFSSTPVGYKIVVTEFNSKGGSKSYGSDGSDAVGTNLHDSLSFQDTSALDVAYIRVILYNDKGEMVDRREVRMKLNTNGVFEANRDFLAYIYYGTDGTGGAKYTNQRLSDMTGDYKKLTSRMATAEGEINTNTQNIQKVTETAKEYSRQLTQEEKDAREGAVKELQASIEATASGIRTTVKSLYSDGNLLWGCNVQGLFGKTYGVFVSPGTVRVKAGITYTVTARMWMESKDDNHPDELKIPGHHMRLHVFDKDWSNGTVWHKDFYNTKKGNVTDCYSFTPDRDVDVLVGIFEQDANGNDPGSGNYNGVHVDWVRLDMGDWTSHDDGTGEVKSEWTPAAGDTKALNLIPDPGFENGTWSMSEGMSTRWTIGDVSFMSLYKDDYGFNGLRMKRSGYTGEGTSDGLVYHVPFRGEGNYTLQGFFKEFNKVTLDNAAIVEMHPADADKKRICYGWAIGIWHDSNLPGHRLQVITEHFGKTATRTNDDKSTTEVEIRWIELRVFLQKNGDVVLSRLSLAKCDHAVYWNANKIGADNARTLETESYVDQRADSLEGGIRQGLKSVGFKMDGATWSVNTWGNRFAWYATVDDAQKGDTSKAVMYLDTGTNTLHVKGYVEATGGTFNGTVKADLLYGKTLDVTETTNYDIDPNTSPAACFMYRDPSIGIHYITLPKASDYDGLEIQVYFLCTKPLTRAGFPYVYIKPKNGETLYAKESVKVGTKDSNGHIPQFIDLNTDYTAYNGQWCFLARNNLYKFKSIGGNWYAIEGYFGSIY